MKKALIVIDMQNDFVNGSLGNEEIKAIVPAVVKKINDWDGIVITTMDTHDDDYMRTLEGKKLPVPHCMRGTEGWELNDEVLSALPANYLSVEKSTFGSYSLPKWLTQFKEIHIIGVCTDICVVSNALLLRAHYPNTVIVCDASCCAGTTPEKHKAALEVMKSCQIEVINE